MSRRLVLFTAGLTLALAVPASAQANWLVRLPKKPKKVHVIAVRRGHHTVWKAKNHGLAKKKLSVILSGDFVSSDFTFQLNSHAVNTGASNFVQTYSGNCPPTGTETLPLDGVSFYEAYGQGTKTTGSYSDVLTCSGGGWTPPSTSYGTVPLVSGGPGCEFPAENQRTEMPVNGGFVNAEYAWFLDGEWGVICTVPDDNGSGVSHAGADKLTVYQQGFTCQVPVAVLGSGRQIVPANLRNKDSIEVYQSLGNKMYSITTTCIGQLPAGYTPPSTPTTHWLGCQEPNGPAGSGSIKGYGATVTFPDGQYSESCSDPNYQAS
jgi:hypothetical protein